MSTPSTPRTHPLSAGLQIRSSRRGFLLGAGTLAPAASCRLRGRQEGELR